MCIEAALHRRQAGQECSWTDTDWPTTLAQLLHVLLSTFERVPVSLSPSSLLLVCLFTYPLTRPSFNLSCLFDQRCIFYLCTHPSAFFVLLHVFRLGEIGKLISQCVATWTPCQAVTDTVCLWVVSLSPLICTPRTCCLPLIETQLTTESLQAKFRPSRIPGLIIDWVEWWAFFCTAESPRVVLSCLLE